MQEDTGEEDERPSGMLYGLYTHLTNKRGGKKRNIKMEFGNNPKRRMVGSEATQVAST